MDDSAIAKQLGLEGDPNVDLYGDGERFDPMPGVYRSTDVEIGGKLFFCYGVAQGYKRHRGQAVAIVLQLESFEQDEAARSCLAKPLDGKTRFMDREEWNEMAFERIGPLYEGMREKGWA